MSWLRYWSKLSEFLRVFLLTLVKIAINSRSTLLLKSQKICSERFSKINLWLKFFCFVLCVFTIYLFTIYKPEMAASDSSARIETTNRKRWACKDGHKLWGHTLLLKRQKIRFEKLGQITLELTKTFV